MGMEDAKPEIMADGTRHITAAVDVANINCILLTQEGTHSGDLYYKDAQSEHKTCNGCVHWFKRYKAPCASCSRNGSFIDRWEEGEQDG